jgi:drug/metabolite transporter (DMT)-like permease
MKTLSRQSATLLMVLAPLLWSSAGVVTKRLESAQSFETTFWRSLFTALALLVLLPLWQGRGVFARVPWRSPVLWVSGLCWACMFTAFMLALTLTTVANVLITLALGPLLTALFAWGFTGQRLPLRTWVAIAMAVLGIGLMHGTQLRLGGAAGQDALGSLVAFCVPLAAAVMWTMAQREQAKQASGPAQTSIDLLPCVLIGAVISTLLCWPLSTPFSATGSDVAWLAFLGLFQLAIPCSLAVLAARVLKAAEISLLALLEIVFGIAWAWLFVGEQPTTWVLVGGFLILLALALNAWLGMREE